MAEPAAPTGLKPKTKGQRYLLIGGLGAGGILGYRWYKNRSAAASTAQTGTDPSIDPVTGIPYAQEAGYGGGAVGTTPGALGTYNPLTQQYTPGYGAPIASVPASNAQWATAAETALTGEGFDPVTTATALGLYLSGQSLNQDQYDIVQAALGQEGQPPTSVPSPILNRGGGTGNSGNGSTGTGQTFPAPQPVVGFGPRPAIPVGTLPNITGVEIWSALGDLVRAGYQPGTVSYNRQNVDYNNYLGRTVASYTLVPGTNRVNIGLN